MTMTYLYLSIILISMAVALGIWFHHINRTPLRHQLLGTPRTER
jgi:hypothetical protein